MELASFFGASANRGKDVDREIVEKCAADWLSTGIDQDGSGVVVVRCGKDGCYVASRISVSQCNCETGSFQRDLRQPTTVTSK